MAASLLLAATTTLSGLFMRGPVLVLTSDDGQLDACWRVSSGEVITVIFTNSMYGGDVRESFRVDRDALTRVAFETENVAAAEYYAYDRRIEPTGSGYRVELPAEVFARIPIRIDERGDYRLHIAGGDVALSESVNGSSGAVLAVESRSMAGRFGCS
jgi:hypothetical protein